MISARALTSEEWRTWRELRLAALRDAPEAFDATLADWQGAGDTELRWRLRLEAVSANVVADLDGHDAGMVSATAPDSDGAVELISMWVAPFARGQGVGDSLVQAVLQWASAAGAIRLRLRVAAWNAPAMALYRRNGFVEGRVLEEDEGGACELEMERLL